jgi:hypothetical protein
MDGHPGDPSPMIGWQPMSLEDSGHRMARMNLCLRRPAWYGAGTLRSNLLLDPLDLLDLEDLSISISIIASIIVHI